MRRALEYRPWKGFGLWGLLTVAGLSVGGGGEQAAFLCAIGFGSAFFWSLV